MRKQKLSPGQLAFTLTEWLVCIGLLVILAALLSPAVMRSMEQSRTTKCLFQQKQILSGLLLYAAEHGGQLPHYQVILEDGTGQPASHWWDVTAPYLNLPTGSSITRVFRCPAAPPRVTTTVGVHYAEVPNRAPFAIKGGGKPGSMNLKRVSRSTVLVADIECPAGHLWFLSPNQFPLTVDSDGDGVADSRPGKPSNNWFAPRHGGSAVCGFADGSMKLVSLGDWARNEGRMWGP